MDVREAQKAMRLRKLVAKLSLDKGASQSVIAKTAGDHNDAGFCSACPVAFCLHGAPRRKKHKHGERSTYGLALLAQLAVVSIHAPT